MFLLLVICVIFGWNLSAQNLVVLDLGHGGNDRGTTGQKMTYEKDVVLRVAKEMVKLNKNLYNDKLDIYLTRYADTLIALGDRGRLAKMLQADMFISLHCNHSANINARGIEVYVAMDDYGHSETSVWLAYQLQKQLEEKLGYKSRGVKFANFQVLRETTNTMPSVLVELGFLSNQDESNHFQKPESYRAVALVLLKILIKNFESYENFRD